MLIILGLLFATKSPPHRGQNGRGGTNDRCCCFWSCWLGLSSHISLSLFSRVVQSRGQVKGGFSRLCSISPVHPAATGRLNHPTSARTSMRSKSIVWTSFSLLAHFNFISYFHVDGCLLTQEKILRKFFSATMFTGTTFSKKPNKYFFSKR